VKYRRMLSITEVMLNAASPFQSEDCSW